MYRSRKTPRRILDPAEYAQANLEHKKYYIHEIPIDVISHIHHGRLTVKEIKKKRADARLRKYGFGGGFGVFPSDMDYNQKEVYRVKSKDGKIDKIVVYDGVLPFVRKVAGEDTTLYNYGFHNPKTKKAYIVHYDDIPNYTFYRYEPDFKERMRVNAWRRRRHLLAAFYDAPLPSATGIPRGGSDANVTGATNAASADPYFGLPTANVTGATNAAFAPIPEQKKTLAEIFAGKGKTPLNIPEFNPSGITGGGSAAAAAPTSEKKKITWDPTKVLAATPWSPPGLGGGARKSRRQRKTQRQRKTRRTQRKV